MKPCKHPDIAPGGPQEGVCRVCWLYANDRRYQRLWADGACPHLWKRVRDEQGAVKTRLCKAG